MNALVSVVVVSYNSAKFIVETLESVKNQTYESLELIISDDGSKDNTIEVCRNWITENSHYFSTCKIIESEANTGIPANCNRGIKATRGEWIKLIAADDLLTENCIRDFISFSTQNPGAKAIHSQSAYYLNTFHEQNFMHISDAKDDLFNSENISANQQFKILLQGCYVNTPTVIIKKEVYENYGYFREEIKTLEDWPMWIWLSKRGIKFFYLPEVTVKYRVHNKSVTNIDRDTDLITKQQLVEREVYKNYISPELSGLRKFMEDTEDLRLEMLLKMGFRKRTFFGKIINFTSYKILNFARIMVKNNELKKLSLEINNNSHQNLN